MASATLIIVNIRFKSDQAVSRVLTDENRYMR